MKKTHPSVPPFGKEPNAWPPVDLVREGDFLVLTVSLPGLRADDFRISLTGNRQVNIEGVVPYRHPVPREQMVLMERPYGQFSRTIQLPLAVHAQGVAITFERGVLIARMPLQLQRLALQWAEREG